MTDIDISPEAVDILIAVWEMGGLQQSELHLLTDTCRALSAALTKLQQGQPYRYIGKDMKTILARDLEDQRDAAIAALTQSRAETAAAYERAAQKVFSDQWPTYGDAKRISESIRALATPEQSSALAAVEAAAEARGMRKAAALARQALVDGAYIKRGSHQEKPSSVMFLAETLVSNAILAAIPQGDTTND